MLQTLTIAILCAFCLSTAIAQEQSCKETIASLDNDHDLTLDIKEFIYLTDAIEIHKQKIDSIEK